MDHPSPQGAGRTPAPGQPGVIGIALAAVLTVAFAEGSWQWFSAYLGATLLALIFTFYRLPPWTPGAGSAYLRGLVAYSLVVGLCVAITLAPALQRWRWLFPMPGTRSACPELGRYEGIRARAALTHLTGGDRSAMAHAVESQGHAAVADCLAATTTRWLPVYAVGVAVLVGLGAWLLGRARAGNEGATPPRAPRGD